MYALAMASNKAREVSAQEAIWILLKYPLIQITREVIDVAVSPISSRMRVVPSRVRAATLDDAETNWESTAPDSKHGMKLNYAAKPIDDGWEDVNLHEFLSYWVWTSKKVNGEECVMLQHERGFIMKRKHVAVINPIPFFPVDFTCENSCNGLLILFVPWRVEEGWKQTHLSAVDALAAARANMPEHILRSMDSMYNVDAATQQIHENACNGVQPVPRHETTPRGYYND
jgi:hypothetical protein